MLVVDFNKLKEFPAYKNVPLTEEEILTNSITGETWILAETHYRQLSAASPEIRIVSIGDNLSFAEAANEVAQKTEKGEELVRVYKGLVKHIGKIVLEDEDAK